MMLDIRANSWDLHWRAPGLTWTFLPEANIILVNQQNARQDIPAGDNYCQES